MSGSDVAYKTEQGEQAESYWLRWLRAVLDPQAARRGDHQDFDPAVSRSEMTGVLISHPANAVPPNELVYWIAQRGEGAQLLREHRRGPDGACVSCGHLWPCGLRRSAEESFKLLPEVGPGSEPVGRTRRGAVTIWRGETFWDDGICARAEWLGRADYPDPDTVRWWLAITLETCRHRERPGDTGLFWGEVTAGHVSMDRAESHGSVVLLGNWRPIEKRGATATAYLRTPNEPIEWDDDLGKRSTARSVPVR